MIVFLCLQISSAAQNKNFWVHKSTCMLRKHVINTNGSTPLNESHSPICNLQDLLSSFFHVYKFPPLLETETFNYMKGITHETSDQQ